ncbi:SMI1/KNR4 family protein [Chitinophaga silvatica]|uniref:SMI1/KNR4 family protein n=1 Tax=Chitinophaga silvatica TaxID=2282649 RepID=A0A3E1YFW7_9BACT|nr:SMI1/KNR4 family protein [Chitinophaga silvatica]RFS26269.1 SMI1/KNR4 family protein [Chitinophaga silvatica]
MTPSNSLIENIEKMIRHWNNQNIPINQLNPQRLLDFEKYRDIQLPHDFKEFYLRINGMESHFPNYTDSEGFLFYPLNYWISAENEFMLTEHSSSFSKILIFADYMQKCWWYGVKLNDSDGTYEIGIIPYKEKFKVITDSLAEFIDYYLQDSAILYNYQ